MAATTDPVQHPQGGLTPTLRIGLIFVGVIALASATSTIALTGFISYRGSRWHRFYSKDIKRNVFVVLLCNLFLADLFQALGFLFSWHWLRLEQIVTGTDACSAQGFLINFGDVASAFFVLAIALQTWAHLRFQRQLRFDAFLAIVICMWIFALVLTVLGPVLSSGYFVNTGAWCWADAKYTSQRLAYHYFWIFLVQFGSVVVYGFVIWELRRSSSKLHTQHELSSQQAKDTHRRIRKSCLIMCFYPIAYIALTLPLAVSRMYEVSGTKSSLAYRIFCGCFLVSSGWVDALLYVLTRASFLKSQGHCRDGEDEGSDGRQSRASPTPTPPLKDFPRAVHSPSSSRRCRESPGPIARPMRMDSISSWKSDSKSISHGRTATVPVSTFDPELLLMSSRTLTLSAKVCTTPLEPH